MSRTKGATDVASRVRGALMRGLMLNEQCGRKKTDTYVHRGMGPSEIIQDMVSKGNLLEVLKVVSRYVPKEMLLDASVDVRSVDDITDEERDVIRLIRQSNTLIESDQDENVTH